MQYINIHDAKTHLSKYLAHLVGTHETIVICRNGTPVAQLTEFKKPKKRLMGLGKGRIQISDDFDDSLPEDIMQSFT